MTYNHAAFREAHSKFLTDAKSLTDDDLEQFAIVDPKLADRARARRAGFVEADTDTAAEKKMLAAPVTHGTMLEYFADYIAPVLANHRYRITDTRDLLVALEQRLTATERKPHVKFCGVWKADGTYGPGDAATHHGSLWICKASSPGEPSKDFVGWQLAVKRGAA